MIARCLRHLPFLLVMVPQHQVRVKRLSRWCGARWSLSVRPLVSAPNGADTSAVVSARNSVMRCCITGSGVPLWFSTSSETMEVLIEGLGRPNQYNRVESRAASAIRKMLNSGVTRNESRPVEVSGG